jgi:hypothetical protein
VEVVRVAEAEVVAGVAEEEAEVVAVVAAEEVEAEVGEAAGRLA